MTKSDLKNSRGIQSIEVGFTVIREMLNAGKPLTMTEIAKASSSLTRVSALLRSCE
jgi:hypothetical protein